MGKLPRGTFSSRQGFTVLELLVFAAIFTMIALTFVSILVAVTQIQTRQNSFSQVNKETLFLLQTMQRFIESASAIDMAPDLSVSTLTLRMASSSLDPTLVFTSTTEVWYREGTSTPVTRLNSPKVIVENLTFTKRETPGGQDRVMISFVVRFNSSNPRQQFARSINTSIARRNAAIFDSGVYPSSTASSKKLGDATKRWVSINDIMFFGPSGVGIGTGAATPRAALQVSDGDFYLQGDYNRLFLGSTYAFFNGEFSEYVFVCKQLKVDNSGALLVATTTIGYPKSCPSDYGWLGLAEQRHFAGIFTPRAHAAYFSSGLFPGGGEGNYKLGSVSQPWDSLNDRVYFDAVNNFVGINTSLPKTRLHAYDDSSGDGRIFINPLWDEFNGLIYGDRGVIFTAPDGRCWRWRLTRTASPGLTNGGVAVTCPVSVARSNNGSTSDHSALAPAAQAATVDGGIFPSSDAPVPRKLGDASLRWESVSDILYYSSLQKIGIGKRNGSVFSTPDAFLHIIDGDIYFDAPRKGMIFQSQDQRCWKWTVINNSGAFATSSNRLIAMNCPS